jgi:hypothetical protein
MAALHETTVYDVCDVKVYKLLSDSTAASPTYGPAVDLPLVSQLGLDLGITSAELKGDCKTGARVARLDKLTGSFQNGKMALDVLAAIIGGTVTDAGTGSNEVADWKVIAPLSLPYFRLIATIEDVDEGLGQLQLWLPKCKVTGGTLFGQQTDQFGTPSMQFDAIPPYHPATPLIDVFLYETDTAIPA